MSDRQTLSRAERLRTLNVIRRLFSEGESRFVYPFRVVWLPDKTAESPEKQEVSESAEAPGIAEASKVPRTNETPEAKGAEIAGTVETVGTAGTIAGIQTEASAVNDSEVAKISGTAEVLEIAAVAIPEIPEIPEDAGVLETATPVAASRPIAPVAPQLRVLFSVPKKFHKRANRRNLLRRRTKEAYRLQKSSLHLRHPLNIALIYTSREVENYDRIAHAIRKIIALLNTLNP